LGTTDWGELGCLTARLRELQLQCDAAPRGRIGWLRELDSQILTVEAQRDRLLAHLSWRLFSASLHRTPLRRPEIAVPDPISAVAMSLGLSAR